jgi:hypothetical protein
MLKKLLTGTLAAGAVAVPLAAVAWADPPPNPNPPAVPASNGQGPANLATPAVAGPNGQAPVCVVSANAPAPETSVQGTAQGTSPVTNAQGPGTTTWRQVATLQGSDATDLGLPAGQPMKVFCAPAGTQNPQGQPAGAEIPGQPNVGQPNPAQNPVQNQPGQPGTQNSVPGQQ